MGFLRKEDELLQTETDSWDGYSSEEILERPGEVMTEMGLIRKESALTDSIGKELWWYVVLRGGLIFGVLSLLPLTILVEIFLYLTNGTWLFSYNRSAAKRMSDVTDIWYIAGLALFYFVGGSLIGFGWWILHRMEVRKRQARKRN